MRAIPAVSLFVLVLLLLTQAPSDAGELPAWRFQVRAYGPEQASLVALHHRVGSRSELGIQVTGRFSDMQSDEGRDYERREERFDRSYSFRPEYRRWTHRDDRLATFWGANLLLGFSAGESYREASEYQSEYNEDRESTRLGVGASIGADLELLEHLSVSMIVAPISLTHEWADKKSIYGPVDPEQETRFRKRDLILDLNLTPSLYACLRF